MYSSLYIIGAIAVIIVVLKVLGLYSTAATEARTSWSARVRGVPAPAIRR